MAATSLVIGTAGAIVLLLTVRFIRKRIIRKRLERIKALEALNPVSWHVTWICENCDPPRYSDGSLLNAVDHYGVTHHLHPDQALIQYWKLDPVQKEEARKAYYEYVVTYGPQKIS